MGCLKNYSKSADQHSLKGIGKYFTVCTILLYGGVFALGEIIESLGGRRGLPTMFGPSLHPMSLFGG